MSFLGLACIYGFPILAFLVLGITILINQRANGLKRIFAAMCFLFGTWSFLLLLTDLSDQGNSRLALLRSAVLVGNYIPLLFVLFCLWFVERRSRTLVVIGTSIAVFLTVFSYSRLTIGAIGPGVGAQPSQIGPLYVLQSLYAVVFFIIGVVLLLRGTRTNSVKRSQARLIAGGLALATTINVITGFILVVMGAGNKVGLLGPPSLMIFVFSMYVAIARYRVFDVRPYIARVTAFIVTIAFLLSSLLLARALVIGLFPETMIRDFIDALSLVLLAAAYPYLLAGFQKATNRLFFQTYYEPSAMLSKATAILAYETSLDVVLQKSANFLHEVLGVNSIIIDVEPGTYTPRGRAVVGSGLAGARYIRRLTELARKQQSGWISHEQILVKYPRYSSLETIIPLGSDDEYIGVLAIGLKKSGTPLDERDRRFLKVFVHGLSLASKNARNYQEITRFGQILKIEVDQATLKLKRTNRRLKAVSVAKDEFVSMAAHQLRPQLAATLGFVDLLRRGGGGAPTPEQSKLLSYAHTSVGRMIYLVSNMLSASHSESGKLTLEVSYFNMSDMVVQEVTSLQAIAVRSRVRFDYTGVQDNIWYHGDEPKMREIVLNLLDNAANYSPDNAVVYVLLSATAQQLEFTVKDSGIGVPPQSQKKLFGKFFRADNARAVRPTGTGVGLFVARNIVRAHGGDMIFSSVLGKGSVFGFTLPLKRFKDSHGS